MSAAILPVLDIAGSQNFVHNGLVCAVAHVNGVLLRHTLSSPVNGVRLRHTLSSPVNGV